MTWHQWHHTAPMSSRMGLFSRCAVAKASSPHSCHWMGWRIAERRYAEDACDKELVASDMNLESSRDERGARSNSADKQERGTGPRSMASRRDSALEMGF